MIFDKIPIYLQRIPEIYGEKHFLKKKKTLGQ